MTIMRLYYLEKIDGQKPRRNAEALIEREAISLSR
jgi:hypothetical protein